jgi:acyl carrier protein
MNDINEKIKNFITNMAENKGSNIDISSDLFELGILDSLNIIILISYIADELKINIPNNELIIQNFQSIESIYNLVLRYKNK